MSEKSRQWKSSFNRCCPLCWLVLDTRPTDGVRGHAGRSDWEWTDLLYWWHKRWWEDLELVSFMPQHFLSNWVLSACWNGYYWFPLKHCLSLFTYLFFFLHRWNSFRTLCDYNKRICLGERTHCEAATWGKLRALRNNYAPVCYWDCASFVFLKRLKLDQICHQTLWLINGSENLSKQPFSPPASSSPIRRASLFCRKPIRE